MANAIKYERGMIEVAPPAVDEAEKPHQRRERTANAAQRPYLQFPTPARGGFFQSLFGGGAPTYSRPIPPARIR
jgi:hypothetical protein